MRHERFGVRAHVALALHLPKPDNPLFDMTRMLDDVERAG